jgi:soluble lytic murein transglycosylase-like protein
MGINPAAHGQPSPAHVSLREAGRIAWRNAAAGFALPQSASSAASRLRPAPSPTAAGTSDVQRSALIPSGSAVSAADSSAALPAPHTAVESNYEQGGRDQWDDLLRGLGQKYNVPWLFLKAVMLSESGGRPDAVGDAGSSVGLFQLHERGYGYEMGDARFDPVQNAERGTQGLAKSFRKVVGNGPVDEAAVRNTYDDTFNPGGGWAYQGDSVVRHYNALLAERGLPSLS